MITITREHADEMVAAAAKWNNAHRPANWPHLINLTTLNIADGETCIFGQLYAEESLNCGCTDGWHHATEHGLINWNRTYELGLAARYEHGHDAEWQANVDTLNAAWTDLITRLRETTPA